MRRWRRKTCATNKQTKVYSHTRSRTFSFHLNIPSGRRFVAVTSFQHARIVRWSGEKKLTDFFMNKIIILATHEWKMNANNNIIQWNESPSHSHRHAIINVYNILRQMNDATAWQMNAGEFSPNCMSMMSWVCRVIFCAESTCHKNNVYFGVLKNSKLRLRKNTKNRVFNSDIKYRRGSAVIK